MHDQLVVFDIETVIDTNAAARLLGLDSNDNPQALRKALEDYHLEITGGNNAFPRQLFHQVVAISFLRAEIERNGSTEVYHLQELRSGGTTESSEEELIKGFFNWCDKYKPRFVSFNGRTFDLPVLRYRAMKYGVNAPWFYNMGDKWNNYLQRYSSDWHADLLDMLSDYGASARIRLNEVCALLSLPGKLDTDGGDVQTLYNEGKIQEIRDYCETDVLNTWLLYLHLMKHRGNLDPVAFDMAIEQTTELLQMEGKSKPHYQEFWQAWQNKSR
ncbi:MAG: 3'-5' exonuclease [Alphaproteobacteria bacterium]